MNITGLQIENFKRIKALAIDVDGAMIVIGGKNGAGKTSVMDAVSSALGGKTLCPEVPIRAGQKSAFAEVKFPEMTVRRTWELRKDGSVKTEVIVTNAKGVVALNPQELLDKLLGRLTFDPLTFARLGGTAKGRREQADILREIYKLDFSEEERKTEEAKEKRKFLNNELKNLSARLSAMPLVPAPEKEINVAELMSELQNAQANNRACDDIDLAYSDALSDIDRFAREAKDLNEQIEALQAKLKTTLAYKEKAVAEERRIAGEIQNYSRLETEHITKRISEADAVNARVRSNRARAELAERKGELESQIAEQEAAIEDAAASKAMKLSEAQFPIDGLGITEDGVTLNGLPLDQACESEKLKLSVAIGFEQNPTINIILIRDGSLLDSNSRKMIVQMAQEHGGQVWMEVVEEGAECSVVIEDGMVKLSA